MDTRELELFIALAETLHFGRAAERMHLSPSAVSRTLQRMEEELGQRLLERDSRQVRLTPAGQHLLQFARQQLAQWRAFVESIQPHYRLLRGEISLYCSVTAAHSLLADLLPTFRNRYPGIELKLYTGDQADAIDRALHGDEDLAIAALPARAPRRLQVQVLAQSPLVFIAPSAPASFSPLLEQRPIPWEQIPLIQSERGLGRQRLDRWFREQGLRPNVYAQVSGHEAIVSMVALGFGVSLVPELVLATTPQRDSVRRLDVAHSMAPFSVGLCVREQRLESPLVQAFWECARASNQPTF